MKEIIKRLLLIATMMSFGVNAQAQNINEILGKLLAEEEAECGSLVNLARTECVKQLNRKRQHRLNFEFNALKLSREGYIITHDNLPNFGDSVSDAESKAASLCLYEDLGSYLHCGYYGGLYVSEIDISIEDNFILSDRVRAIVLRLETNRSVISTIREAFTKREKSEAVLSCLDRILEVLNRPSKGTLEDACRVLLVKNTTTGQALELSYLPTFGEKGFLSLIMLRQQSRESE